MKILVFTGSRGEWGYLKPLLKRFINKEINFEICVTNMHLLHSKGYTISEIIEDGFQVKYKIPIYGTEEHLIATPKAISLISSSLSDIFYSNKYDYLLVAGDRFETLAAVMTAFYSEIPIGHIQAGEKSGNKDDMARHAIARFSSLHFASNEDAYERLKKSGEEDWRIFLTGAPQLDDINKFVANKKRKNHEALVILHPETLGLDTDVKVENIVEFLLKNEYYLNIILPNTDSGSNLIVNQINRISSHKVFIHRNMNRDKYLKLLSSCSFLIGNSSSGIIEAPFMKTPVINIGNRQRGRIQASNVINIKDTSSESLHQAISILKSEKFKISLENCHSPYGDGNSSNRIIEKLEEQLTNSKILKKFLTI